MCSRLAVCLNLLLIAGLAGCAPFEPAPAEAEPPAPAAPGPVLRGVVLLDGTPVQARVTVWRMRDLAGPPREWRWRLFSGTDPAPRGVVDAGPDGDYALRDLPAGTYRIEAVTPDGARGRTTAWIGDVGHESEPLEPILVRPDRCTVRGRAVTPDGRPWTGTIDVDDSEFPLEPTRPVVTGPDGRFVVDGRPGTEIRLAVVEPGRRLIRGPAVLLPCEEEVVFVVGDGWRVEEGVVTSDADGSPVPGARVLASFGEEGDDGWSSATADASGRFQLPARADTDVNFRVSGEGFAPGRSFRAAGDEPDLHFGLRRGAVLSGLVLDATEGTTLHGTDVHFIPDGDGGPHGGYRTTTGPDGRYVLRDLPPGGGHLLFLGHGRFLEEEVAPGLGDERVARVHRASRARGRVLDADGAPVPGAVVEAVTPGYADSPAERRLRDVDPSGEPVTADPDGHFEIPLLVPGLSYGLVASVGGHRVAAVGPFRADPGGEWQVDLHLPPDRRVQVEVRAAAGEGPARGVRVEKRATLLPGEEMDLGRATPVGPDGTAAVGPLPDGPVRFYARSADWNWTSEEVEHAGADGEVVILVQPDPATGDTGIRVEGVVLLPDGSPAVGARLTLWSSPFGCLNDMPLRRPRADIRGRFRLSVGFRSVNLQAELRRGGRCHAAFVSPDVDEDTDAIRGLVVRLIEVDE